MVNPPLNKQLLNPFAQATCTAPSYTPPAAEWPVTEWPRAKCRADFTPEERKAVVAAQIAYINSKPHARARYRFLEMLQVEGPLPFYKDFDYFDYAEKQREEMRRRDEVSLDEWAGANG
jgi:hypothetical protein